MPNIERKEPLDTAGMTRRDLLTTGTMAATGMALAGSPLLSAADTILPLAADNGIAVLSNMPFGGQRNAASMFARASGAPLPDWAGEIDVNTWAQFFLKYVVSHPAVTVAIPGTTKPHHLEDNLGAARGCLPDDQMRREMERYWEAV